MWKLTSRLTRLAMLAFAVFPLFADLPSYSIDGYTIYDCGAAGSAGYQSCLSAMTRGEAEFMGAYTPTGSPLPSDWASLLPPPPVGNQSYWDPAAISPDGLSTLITWNVDGGDQSTKYIWHDGAFTAVLPEGLSAGTRPEVYLNDQGTIAGSGDQYLFLETLAGGSLVGGAYYDEPRPELTLNDDNQLLAVGLGLECLETGKDCGDYSDSILVDPFGAPVPDPAPEPASLALLATVVALMIPLIRKIQVDRRAQKDCPIPRDSDV